jgi:hypothetical protein
MTEYPRPGEIWRHCNGGRYEIYGIGFDTKSGDAVMIYQSMDHGSTWVRPLGEFLGYTEDKNLRFVKETDLTPNNEANL